MNIIDEDSFDKLKEHVVLKSTRAKLFAYNPTVPLPLLARLRLLCQQRNDVTQQIFML